MTMIIDGTNGITFPDTSKQYNSYYNFKNRIINGAMVIDQRNAGASVTLAGSGTYTVDRWQGYEDTDGAMTAQQDSSAPTGFINSLKLTTTTNDSSLSSTQFALVQHKIEGLNISDLGWGTASAATVTLSFWVRSSLTGTFGGSVRNSAQNRSYPFTFTISAADTWEQKTITIAGDTTGTWLTTNGIGIQVAFGLGVGSSYSGTSGSWAAAQYFSATGATSVVGTNGATFYITGVQLEKGTQATSFDYRPYGTELALCQRYYYKSFPAAVSKSLNGFGSNNTTTNARFSTTFPTSMRIAPTALEQSGTANQYAVSQAGIGSTVCSSVPVFATATPDNATTGFVVASGLTQFTPSNPNTDATNGATAFLAWSAEL